MSTPANLVTLNQYAKGLFQETANEDADFLAPVVPTGAASFFVNDYAKETGFNIPDSRRAIGGDSTAVKSDGDRIRVDLNPHGLHDIIDTHELAQAGEGAGKSLLRQGRTRNLVSQGGNSRFAETLKVVRGVVSATPSVWGSSADPIKIIDAQIAAIAEATGKVPNRIMFSLSAWIIFKNHAEVIKRHPGSGQVNVTTESASGLFANPNIKIKVSATTFNESKGGTSSKKFATINEVLVYYASEMADMFDGSFTKTFRITDNPFQSVRVSPKDYGEKIMLDWTEEVYVNNPAAGVRLTVTES
jgi:hypothetical protein